MRRIYGAMTPMTAILVLLTCIIASISTRAARADDGITCMTKAMARVASAVRLVSDKSQFGYQKGLSLLGAYIRQGAECTITLPLQKGEAYAFVGAGDDDVKILNIVVEDDATGDVVAKDEDTEKFAMVIFEPNKTGKYRVKLRFLKGSVLDGTKVPSFCGLGILRKGGWDVPTSNLVDAVGRCMAKVQSLAAPGLAHHFLDIPNQWSFFGGVANEGSEMTLNKMTLGAGSHLFCAASDTHANAIKFSLLNDQEDVIKEDAYDDTFKIFAASTVGSKTYGLRLINKDSKSPSMIVGVVLDQERTQESPPVRTRL